MFSEGSAGMENREKTGWALPLVFAIGACAYYWSTLKLRPDPDERRRTILRRIHDGTSPRTLLKEGFSPAELLSAGVPGDVLRSTSPTSSMTTPSVTPREYHDPSLPRRSRLFSWVYDSLVQMTDAMQAASEGLRDNFGGHGESSGGGNSPGFSHQCTSSTKTSTRPNTAQLATPSSVSLRSSIRLTAPAPCSLTPTEFYDCYSPERSISRSPYAAMRVRVSALSAPLPRGYVEESASNRYPLEVLRFLHGDGSRLSVMAECCVFNQTDTALTTAAYAQRSLSRAAAAAEKARMYFKVKLSSAAHNIATTVMESYVNIHVGPSPVILASFYLVKDEVAYTIQLQTQTESYEDRLSDLLYTAQNARLLGRDASHVTQKCNKGRQLHHVQAAGSDRLYVVETPVEVVVRAEAEGHNRRDELVLTPCQGSSAGVKWEGKVSIRPASASSHPLSPPPLEAQSNKELLRTVQLFSDAFVTVDLQVVICSRSSTFLSTSATPIDLPSVLTSVAVRAAAEGDAQYQGSVYRSAELTMPLPRPESFLTWVCEHPHEPFVTLFIAPRTSSELFEVELHYLCALSEESLGQLFAYLKRLLLTPANPKHFTNAAGQACFTVDGLAAEPTETTLHVYGVQVEQGCWLIVRWLYPDSAVVPSELEKYGRELMDNVQCW